MDFFARHNSKWREEANPDIDQGWHEAIFGGSWITHVVQVLDADTPLSPALEDAGIVKAIIAEGDVDEL
jgi:hypothetical protein